MQLSGNTVLITGGATGIGYAMAEAFLEAGSTVIICGRRESDSLKPVRNIPTFTHASATCPRKRIARSWRSGPRASFPALNVLVNNAGVQRDVDLTQGVDDFLAGENEIRVNLESPIILSGLFVPHLAKNKGAAIMNVSSGLGFVPAARMPIYSASKAGLHAYCMAVRMQLSKVGIKCSKSFPPRSILNSIRLVEPDGGTLKLI